MAHEDVLLASFFCVERWKEVNDVRMYVGCHRVSSKQAKLQPPERCVSLFCNLNLLQIMQFVARYNIYTVFKSEIKTTAVCINLSKFTVAQKVVYMYKFLGN